MPRPPRVDRGGLIFHVMNRGNGRVTIFDDEDDFFAFERVLEEALGKRPEVQLLSHVVMPNHWHLVVRTTEDGVLSRFVSWLTLTHTHRWHAHRQNAGEGHLYQGRFRSFIVQQGGAMVRVCRYVERNPLRANLVTRAEDWRFGSLWRWSRGSTEQKALLHAWPDPPGRRPPGWVDRVNTPVDEKEAEALRVCMRRDRPFGETTWRDHVIRQYGLESTLRARGRPRKAD